MKFLPLIIGCVCVATVLSEAVGFGLLWWRGHLNEHTVQEIRLILMGGEAETAEIDESRDRPKPSLGDVSNVRSMVAAEFDARESEVTRIKELLAERSERLAADQAAFAQKKQNFEQELQRLTEQTASEAVEQARGVLLALPPKNAVEQLSGQSVDDAVVLLKGMPDKAIAKILKEFSQDDRRADQGRKIFEALKRGEPTRAFLEQMRNGATAAAGNAIPREGDGGT
jgi:hypothetical protein